MTWGHVGSEDVPTCMYVGSTGHCLKKGHNGILACPWWLAAYSGWQNLGLGDSNDQSTWDADFHHECLVFLSSILQDLRTRWSTTYHTRDQRRKVLLESGVWMQGVPLSQGNLAASLANIAATYELTPKDRSLLVMPLFHVHGLMAGESPALSNNCGSCRAMTKGRGVDWWDGTLRGTFPPWL